MDVTYVCIYVFLVLYLREAFLLYSLLISLLLLVEDFGEKNLLVSLYTDDLGFAIEKFFIGFSLLCLPVVGFTYVLGLWSCSLKRVPVSGVISVWSWIKVS